MSAEKDKREHRLARARLYLICGAEPGGTEPEPFLRAALAGGVDVVQLRQKGAGDDGLLAAAARFRSCCDEQDALFILNDRPDLARAAGADGAHVGQDDEPLERARELAGEELLVGVSTHTPEQVDTARDGGADYIGVGPVLATPTKPDEPAVGFGLVEYAAEHEHVVPFFAIGGIDRLTLAAVMAAGARRIAVVRAIVDASDPGAAARELRQGLEGAPQETGFGAA
ncbi:MAG: thiamine-phosphate pyrophosphorylase [Solirubrobacteraceae bacterium]|nr:thiamine-phosphate pyrophosphorylase [Solirubrobacteraceae bacterium]